MSNFWERVDEELNFKGMTRKALATEVNFNLGNVGKGIKLNSCPSAETAIKIAKVLNVSVEYLVNGNQKSNTKQNFDNEILLYKKYHTLIEKCEHLSKENIKLLEQLADGLIK